MITVKDLKAIEFIAYMAEELYPAIAKRMNKEIYYPTDIEQTTERVKADLRKIRRLAMNISNNLE